MSNQSFNDMVLASLVEALTPALEKRISLPAHESAQQALKDACERIDELLVENSSLGEAVERQAADGQRLVLENQQLTEKIERQRVALAGHTESHDRKNLRISLLMAKAAKESQAREEAEQRAAKISSESAAMRSAHESIVMAMEGQMQQMQQKIDALQQENGKHLEDLERLSLRLAAARGSATARETLPQDAAKSATNKPSVSVKGAKSALCVKGDVAMAARDGCLVTKADLEWDNK